VAAFPPTLSLSVLHMDARSRAAAEASVSVPAVSSFSASSIAQTFDVRRAQGDVPRALREHPVGMPPVLAVDLVFLTRTRSCGCVVADVFRAGRHRR
jgi:hypothetical protein